MEAPEAGGSKNRSMCSPPVFELKMWINYITHNVYVSRDKNENYEEKIDSKCCLFDSICRIIGDSSQDYDSIFFNQSEALVT